MNIVIDKGSSKVAGLNRSAFSNEQVVELDAQEIQQLQPKLIQWEELEDVLDSENNQIYYLPQEDIIEYDTVTDTIETTDELDVEGNPNQPIMLPKTKQIPLMVNGEQVKYYPMNIRYEQQQVGVDENNNPIYENVPVEEISDAPILCWETEEYEEQKTDSSGNKLYLTTISDQVPRSVPQEPLQITADDERYVEGLEKVTRQAPKSKVVNFLEDPTQFSLADIQPILDAKKAKQQEIINKFKTAQEKWDELDKVNCTLDEMKFAKLAILNEQCEKTILGKFISIVDGVEYFFSNDMEAQANFDKVDNAFGKGYITSEVWTAYDVNENVVRLLLDAIKFEPIYKDHLGHISNNIAKFRDILMPLIMTSVTKEEVEDIVW